MVPIKYTEFRARLADQLNSVQFQGARILVERRNKVAAALVPAADLDLLEALEDELEEQWARDAVEKALKRGGRPKPAAEVWKELGL